LIESISSKIKEGGTEQRVPATSSGTKNTEKKLFHICAKYSGDNEIVSYGKL
jgi:hypothetical protein